jgi:hypothetical protein
VADDRRRGLRNDHDRGTVLILGPVAVLIVVFLGAIAVDTTGLYLTRRSLADVAAAAANDLATAALDVGAFTATGTVRLDPDRARVLAARELAIHRGQVPTDTTIAIDIVPAAGGDPPEITVTLRATAPGVLLPGNTTITAQASAHPQLG